MGVTRIRLDTERGNGIVQFSVKGSREIATKERGIRVVKEDAFKLANEIVQTVGKLVAVRGSNRDGLNRVDIYVQN